MFQVGNEVWQWHYQYWHANIERRIAIPHRERRWYMAHGIWCLHIWWPGVWRSSGKRPRNTEQDRAPSLLGQHRVSHHDQQSTRICGTGIYWEFARVNSWNAKFLRQSVQVTGLGNTLFDRLLVNIACIHALFKRATGPFLQDEAGVSYFKDFAAIDTSNRYFNPKTWRNQEVECPITANIDPKGFLKKAASNLFVHTEENKVYYYEKHKSSSGEIR